VLCGVNCLNALYNATAILLYSVSWLIESLSINHAVFSVVVASVRCFLAGAGACLTLHFYKLFLFQCFAALVISAAADVAWPKHGAVPVRQHS